MSVMPNNTQPAFRRRTRALSRRSFLAAAAGIGLLGTAGCGGGGKKGAEVGNDSRGTGAASLTVRWPDTLAPSRLIPSASAYIVVRATAAGGFARDYGPVNRPAGQGQTSELLLDGLPVGPVTLTASTFPADRDGQRQAALAMGATQIEIKNGQTTPFSITLDTAIAGFKVAWNGAELPVGAAAPALRPGQSATVTASAVDAAGALVLVDPANFTWAAAGAAVRLDASPGAGTALVTAVSPTAAGTPGETLTVTDKESGRATSFAVPVPARYAIERLPAGDWRAINAAGVVCGRTDVGGGKQAAALWKDGQIVDLGYPAGSLAVSISEAGHVAVNLPNGDVALWKDGHSATLPRFGGAASKGMTAVAVNQGGRVLGTDNADRPRAWTWLDGTFTPLDEGTTVPFPANRTFQPRALNNAGQVVGYYVGGLPSLNTNALIAPDGSVAILYTGAIGGTKGLPSYPRDITDDGRVIGIRGLSGLGGGSGTFHLTPGAYDQPKWLPSPGTPPAGLAFGAAAAGPYTVGELVDGGKGAVLWEGDAPFDLNTLVPPGTGWSLYTATDVNVNGWVLGTGTLNGEEKVPYLARRLY